MNLIYVFLGLLGAFLIAALFGILCGKDEDKSKDHSEIVFVQRVPSPFEAFKLDDNGSEKRHR